MKGTFCVLAVVVAVLDGLGAGADDRADARKAVAGRWKLVGFERGGIGQPQRPVPVGSMTFDAEGGFTASFPDHEMGGAVSIDRAATPAAMDFAHVKGPDKGKAMYAIYKVEGDKLTLSAAPPGKPAKERPTTFDTRDTDNVQFVFERVR